MTPAEQLRWKELLLEVVNEIIRLEGGPVPVKEIRIVPAATFFGLSHGTAIHDGDGTVDLRVAVDRPANEIGDTVLHEIAHVLLGLDHIDNPDHGPEFQRVYAHLKATYLETVEGDLRDAQK